MLRITRLLLVLVLTLSALAPGLGSAATLEVAAGAVVVADDGECSLPEAIHNANADSQVDNDDCLAGSGADTLVLAAGATYTFDTADATNDHNALPVVTSEIVVEGNGATVERSSSLGCAIDGTKDADEFRLLQVTGSGSLTLRGLLLANGCADRGGAVLVGDTASLAVTGVTFVGNTARSAVLAPAQGGALRVGATGAVTIADSRFEANLATGSTAEGGALYDDGALVSLTGCLFVANQALAIEDSALGGEAYGGAAYVTAPAMSRLVFHDNHARGADGSSAGGGAYGGGLYIIGNGATLNDARLARNTAQGGGSASWGGEAWGGGLAHDGGGAVIVRATLDSNQAVGGDGGTASGGQALGGGLFSYYDELLDHLTLSANEARGGASASATGGSASGGGLYVDAGVGGVLRHATITGNRAVAGSGGAGEGQAQGGGVFFGDVLSVGSSVIESNLATVGATTVASPCSDPFGYMTSLGYNTIAEASPDCAFSAIGDQADVGSSLLPLGGHGCTTQLPDGSCPPTHPVAIDSPAQDAGSCTASGATADARGFSRPWDDPGVANADDGCDAGASESRDLDDDGLDDDYQAVVVFVDGFESGNTSAWSQTTP